MQAASSVSAPELLRFPSPLCDEGEFQRCAPAIDRGGGPLDRCQFRLRVVCLCMSVRMNGWMDALRRLTCLLLCLVGSARAMRAGIPPERISISSQRFPEGMAEFLERGVEFNASSLEQLRQFGELPAVLDSPEPVEVGLRFNPGAGSGSHPKTSVGGRTSSFGIWIGEIAEAKKLVESCNVRVRRIHTHIGSGADPQEWVKSTLSTLRVVQEFPDVRIVNLGGGLPVNRMPSAAAELSRESSEVDLVEIGNRIQEQFAEFETETGRRLELEIEPGTWVVARGGSLIATIQDIVSTKAPVAIAAGTTEERKKVDDGDENEDEGVGYVFLKLDLGMTEILRPTMYGAQHQMTVVHRPGGEKQDDLMVEYVVVGHCCESGDLLTCEEGEGETLQPRPLSPAAIGDFLVVDFTGAYCSSMSAKNYNSYPEAAEIMVQDDGPETRLRLIRRRQTLEQIIQNECFE